MRAYALAAIAADRKREVQAKPVEEYRIYNNGSIPREEG
jgi:hypothetical protein